MTNRKRTNYTNMSKYNKYISGDPRTAHLTWQPGDSVQFYLGLMADLTLYFIRASGGSNYNEIINIEDFQEDYLEAQEQYPGSEIILKTGVTRKPITYRQAEQYVIDTLATTENILHNYQKLTNQTREEAKQDFERLNYSAVYINKLGHMDTQEMLDALLGKPRIPAWLERKLTKTTLAEAHKHTNGQNVDINADLGFTIEYPNGDFYIGKPFDLYTMMTDFLIDWDEDKTIMTEYEAENVASIRENYEEVFYAALEGGNYWNAQEFEETFGMFSNYGIANAL